MTTNKNAKVLGVILIFFKTVYTIAWFVAGLFLLVGFILPWSTEVQNELCVVPLNFTLQDTNVSFEIGGVTQTAELMRTSGMLRIKDGPLLLAYIYLFFFLIIMAAILYSLRLVIQIVRRVQEGKIFLLENALALHRIAVVSIFLFLFLIMANIGFNLFTSGRILSKSLIHTGLFGSSMELDLGNLIIPLFLWALAEVFRAGISMKSEHELTI